VVVGGGSTRRGALFVQLLGRWPALSWLDLHEAACLLLYAPSCSVGAGGAMRRLAGFSPQVGEGTGSGAVRKHPSSCSAGGASLKNTHVSRLYWPLLNLFPLFLE